MVPAALQRKIAAQARMQQDEIETTGKQSTYQRAADARARGSSDDEAEEEEDDELAEAGEFYEDVEDLEIGEEDQRVLDVLTDGGAPARTLADVIMAKINERAAAAAGGEGTGAEGDDAVPDLPPKVMEVYTSVGKVLSTCACVARLPPPRSPALRRQSSVSVREALCAACIPSDRSGKLPKAFKIVPRLANWEEVLYV